MSKVRVCTCLELRGSSRPPLRTTQAVARKTRRTGNEDTKRPMHEKTIVTLLFKVNVRFATCLIYFAVYLPYFSSLFLGLTHATQPLTQEWDRRRWQRRGWPPSRGPLIRRCRGAHAGWLGPLCYFTFSVSLAARLGEATGGLLRRDIHLSRGCSRTSERSAEFSPKRSL